MNLQPFAIKYAIDLHNTTPKENGLSLLEVFSGYKSSFDFSKFYTFTSPKYILELILQSENKIPCWNSHLKLGIYLGKSVEYARNVSLILDLISNFVSPPFHKVHDDNFTLFLHKRVHILLSNWSKLFNFKDKIPDNVQVNTLLIAPISNERGPCLLFSIRLLEMRCFYFVISILSNQLALYSVPSSYKPEY